MAVGTRRAFLGAQDPYKRADALLRVGLDRAIEAKAALREALLLLDPQPRVPIPRRAFGQLQPLAPTAAAVADARISLKEPSCDVQYDANLGLTTMVGRAQIQRDVEALAPILDPRSWSCSGGVIAAAFLVTVDEYGQYTASTDLDKVVKLGMSWPNDQPQLLYEYARSEVASFENILRIKEFVVSDTEIKAEYELHDCLVCTFGLASAPGGLTVNEGHVMARLMPDKWWQIEVLKKVQVRDLTPRDPGNRYDFGQWVNSTIGAALSQWVRDASVLSPAF